MPERRADILLVDRDKAVGRELVAFLRERTYAVDWVDDGEKAFNLLDSRLYDVLITELTLPRVDGLRLMAVARHRNPDLCAIIITKGADIARATEAMRQGAYDFQTKPLNLEKLEAVIERGLAYQRLALEQVELRRRLDEQFGLGNLIGRSRQMAKVYNAVRQIGPTPETVLIFGEPGTGKDLIAQAIHNNSARRDEPFVKLDCASLPETVVARELFGVAGGGDPYRGRFELADGGTLYLDGVGELTAALQERLLRVLDEGRIERGGDGKDVSVNVRLIVATNQRLDRLRDAGKFREDLGARLASVAIVAPALRERRDDIPLLAQWALRRASEQYGKTVDNFTRAAMNLLIGYDWPGNVRELCNVVAGMVATARKPGPLDVHDIPEYLRRSAAPEAGEMRIPVGTPMDAIERIAIEETLRVCAYSKEQCAKTLGIGLRTLYRKLKEYGIQ